MQAVYINQDFIGWVTQLNLPILNMLLVLPSSKFGSANLEPYIAIAQLSAKLAKSAERTSDLQFSFCDVHRLYHM